MLTITEIIERSSQGVTRPFLCRCDDGHLYYAKGAGAGWKGLIAEWIAGRLGRDLGLRIPEFDLAELLPSVAEDASPEDRFDLGEFPVFVSQFVPESVELPFSRVGSIPPAEQAQVLLFDCWIQNGDRTLSGFGGNPNLLWSGGAMHLIDHNLAFEQDSLPSILADHVFARSKVLWNDSFRADWQPKLTHAASLLDRYWQELPDAWVERAIGIDLPSVRKIIGRIPWAGMALFKDL